ncbi:MAG: sigma-54 interaction domain-containing protein [bacterium]
MPKKVKQKLQQLAGCSVAIKTVRDFISRVSKTEATVLVTGDTGTGKELIAKSIHLQSRRARKPFVAINCGAIPAELLESELFGHEKGAFTGAFTARKGRFEMAKGGTLFLDEIGDMPLPMQVKILRVLQERNFEKVGSNETQEADVRVIAATHHDLEKLIGEGKFREDLYYRLNVFPIHSPSLHERPEDLSYIIKVLLARFEDEGREQCSLAQDALQALQSYSWPGNVRELENLLERLSILYPDQEIHKQDLPQRYRQGTEPETSSAEVISLQDKRDIKNKEAELEPVEVPDQGFDLKNHLSDLEQQFIIMTLEQNKWVVAKAARQLGMQRTTLIEKMRKYAISKEKSNN